MKLLEIKNNLIKLSYGEGENPILGRFIVLATSTKSYVAQFVNLKSDSVNNFAIAKLLFTFTPDGVVDNYDGSVPSLNSELSFLPPEELLELLPVETPIKIGNLAQLDEMLCLDISVFERNFTVFVEKDMDKTAFISNCARQLFQMKEKSVIIDTGNLFEDFPKIEFAKDFKLPLNSEMIDYLFEYELAEVDASTKAVIQDIFYAVQQYIKSLDFEFLPIDNFVDVVANQYKETQMPELALLKNKLLKYRDANIFATNKEEVLAFGDKLAEKNCSIIDLKNIHESLQKEVIMFVHKALESVQKYIYFFVPLTDGNSDKKLIKQLINNNHVFTTLLVSNSYKYVHELKAHAENIMLFAPLTMQHDFAAYNTFLNKLNPGECIVYGKLTQGIPFIVDMSDLELDLTKDDVFGDKFQFVPVAENVELVNKDGVKLDDIVSNNNNFASQRVSESAEDAAVEDDFIAETQASNALPIPEIPQAPIEVVEETIPAANELTQLENQLSDSMQAGEVSPQDVVIEYPQIPVEDEVVASIAAQEDSVSTQIVEPVANILEEDALSFDEMATESSVESDLSISDFQDEAVIQDDLQLEEDLASGASLTEDDLDFIEDNQLASNEDFFGEELVQNEEAEIVEENSYQESPYVDEQPPVVPVYPSETEPRQAQGSDGSNFAQGDSVSHPRYGRGVVEKIIKYGNKTLCSIAFENVGRRLLDPSVSEFTKI